MAVVEKRAPRPEKVEQVRYVAGRLREAPSTVLVDHRGLDVAAEVDLRRRLREAGVEYHVVKNTLAGLAAADAGLDGLQRFLAGPTAVAFSLADVTGAARVIVEFARDHEHVKVKGGVVEGRVVAGVEVHALAALPSREVLLGRVALAMAAPLGAMAGLLGAPIRALVTVTDQLAKKAGAA